MVHVLVAYLTLSLTPSRGVQALLGSYSTSGGGSGGALFRPLRPTTTSWSRKMSNHHHSHSHHHGKCCTFLSAFSNEDTATSSSSSSSLTVNLPPMPGNDNDSSGASFVMDRRRGTALLLSGAMGLVSSAASLFGTSVAEASAASAADDTIEAARANLISAICNNDNNDDVVLKAIDRLIPFDPSRGRAASSDFEEDLQGEWKLLWSFGAENFSPLLKLPPPFRPTSFQYLGQAAEMEVGPGRAAQGLTGGVLFGQNRQLWLSSGTQSSLNDASILEIFPPFRLQLGGPFQSGQQKITLIEADSDADFRRINGRTTAAQLAPKNLYKQLYLERTTSSSTPSFPGAIGDIGRGSLRISTITEGDPVILGLIFVHQKLQ